MKIKTFISLASVFLSLNAFSQNTDVSLNDMLKKIDHQLDTLANTPSIGTTNVDIDLIIVHIDNNKDNLKELIRISKELDGMMARGSTNICIC